MKPSSPNIGYQAEKIQTCSYKTTTPRYDNTITQ